MSTPSGPSGEPPRPTPEPDLVPQSAREGSHRMPDLVSEPETGPQAAPAPQPLPEQALPPLLPEPDLGAPLPPPDAHFGPGEEDSGEPDADGLVRLPELFYDGPLPRPRFDLNATPWITATHSETRFTKTRIGGLVWLALAVILPLFTLVPVGDIAILNAMVWLVSVVMLVSTLLRRPRRVLTRQTIIIAVLSFLGSLPPGNAISRSFFGQPDAIPRWQALLLLMLAIALLVMPLIAADIWKHRMPRLKTADAKDIFRWGEPGKGLVETIPQFGATNVRDGIEGERLTEAVVLAMLSDMPGVRMVNGMRFPGSASADVDHAVACGNKVAFIDSKAWAPAHYELQQDMETIIVTAQGRQRSAASHMAGAVRGYQVLLHENSSDIGGVVVRGYTLIHPKHEDGELSVGQVSPSSLNTLVTADQLVRELGAWFADDEATVNMALVSFLLMNRK